ncbi:unnamed protein product [Hermetia illucens]|uniref:Peptidase A2 domain-containing protein n=1 Tax=Hermetia illucens TaxID=343691 RepID=A0A7R8YQT6_HERIL|nr:unnamed protein product [Hermetia illucens]
MELATEEQKPVLFRYIQTQIKGDAQLILMNKEFSGWEDLKSELKAVCQEPHSALQLHRELISIKQGHDETVVSYTQRVQTLHRRILQLRSGRVKKGFQAGEINYLNEETLTVFINGLRQTLPTYVITQRPRTVEEAKSANSENVESNKKNENTSSNFKVNAINKVLEIRKEMINSPYIFIKVNGEYIKALIDIESDVSLILKEKVYEHQVNQCAKIKFNGIGGISENSIGKAEIDCLIGNTQHSIEFHVVERYILQDFDALLGIDFLKRNETSFNFKNNILTCGNEDIKIENDDFLVPSRHEVLRFVRVKGKIGENVLVPETKSDCLIVSNSVGTIDKPNRVPITILNTGASNVVCRVNALQVHRVTEEVIPEKPIDKIVIRDEHMNKKEKASIYEIVEKYKDIFKEVDSKNLTKAAVHSIDTIEGAKQVHVKIYRYPKIHEQEVKEQIEKLLKDGTLVTVV